MTRGVGRSRQAYVGRHTIAAARRRTDGEPRSAAGGHPAAAVPHRSSHLGSTAAPRLAEQRSRGADAQPRLRLDADKYLVRVVERVGRVRTHAAAGRIERPHREETVISAAPTPVDMELAAAVIPVEHKGMTRRVVVACIKDRTAQIQLLLKHPHPFGIRIFAFIVTPHAVFITEVVNHRIPGRRRAGIIAQHIGAAPAGIIVHLHSHPHVIAQGSHRINLSHRGRTGQPPRQIAPVVISGVEISAQHAITRVVTMAARPLHRMVPELHNLHSGGSHAPHGRPLGAEIIVVRALVPSGIEQRRNHTPALRLRPRVAQQRVPALLDINSQYRVVIAQLPRSQSLDFSLILTQPKAGFGAHVACHMVRAIPQDRESTVVACHNHKPLAVDMKDKKMTKQGIADELRLRGLAGDTPPEVFRHAERRV